jgi:hypothetical protein
MSKTKEEREHMAAVGQLPCIICNAWPVSVHHALTGAGGRKNHMKVLPLCYGHHQGKEGIHTIGRKKWQEKYGTETELLKKVKEKLHAND